MTESANYYRKRFDLLVFPAIVFNIYYSLFLFFVWSRQIFSESPYPQHFVLPITSQTMILVLIFITGYMGIAYPASRQVSLLLLSLCTFLFILSASLPVYFWGGVTNSSFTPILLVVCVLTIVVIQSQKVRAIFAGISITLLVGLSFYYFPLPRLNPTPVTASVRSDQIYSLFQTSSMLIAILITLYVSWAKHEISFL